MLIFELDRYNLGTKLLLTLPPREFPKKESGDCQSLIISNVNRCSEIFGGKQWIRGDASRKASQTGMYVTKLFIPYIYRVSQKKGGALDGFGFILRHSIIVN